SRVLRSRSCGTLHYATSYTRFLAAILPAIADATLGHRAFSDALSRSVPLCFRQARLKLLFFEHSKRRCGRACINSRILPDSTPRQFAQTFVSLILLSGLTAVRVLRGGPLP